jgi:hypothetical protein
VKPETRKLQSWLRWTIATALGGAAGLVGGLAVTSRLGDEGLTTFGTAIGAVFGLALGLAQALSGRPAAYSGKTWIWVAAWSLVSALGLGLGSVAGFYGSVIFGVLVWSIHVPDTGYILMFAILWLVLALSISAAQHWLLRESTQSAVCWFWRSFLGWLLAGAAGYGAGSLVHGARYLQFGVAGAAGGIVLGAITGAVLVHVRLAPGTPDIQ